MPWAFSRSGAEKVLKEQFSCASVAALGLDGHGGAVAAAGALVEYLRDTQKHALKNFNRLRYSDGKMQLTLDPAGGAYIDSHPDEVKAFLEAQKQVLDRIEADEAQAMEITAQETGLTVEAVKEMVPMYDFDMTIRDSDIEAMKKTVVFMKDNGMIENDVDIEALIWKAE